MAITRSQIARQLLAEGGASLDDAKRMAPEGEFLKGHLRQMVEEALDRPLMVLIKVVEEIMIQYKIKFKADHLSKNTCSRCFN